MSLPRNVANFDGLLEFLRQSRGFDFTGYKRPSLTRRVNRRMEMIDIKTYDEYLDYLQVHPEEFNHLFNTILINVTSFFRDPAAWSYLSRDVLPPLLEAKGSEEPIRVWSAGCASGEEAYSLAIVLAEAVGLEAFRQRVKVYATDVDDEALTVARQATYSLKDLEPVSEELKKKYFEPINTRYVFRTDLRRSVTFGRHDLIQDAPMSGLDLLVCRNTLMYFNAETQVNILNRFHFALNREGFLFLGKAELLLTHANLFSPLEMRHRIFSKVENVNMRDRLFNIPQFVNNDASNHVARQIRLRDAAFEASPTAQLVINSHNALSLATQKARTMFGLVPRDIGRAIHELEIYYRPADLRPLIEQAYAERRTITLSGVERHFSEGEVQYLDLQVSPLHDDKSAPLAVTVTYLDVTASIKLQKELQRSDQELETTSEELQSTNEELETTNEELQSSNEELETMNEELQSTNEELQTVNEEMHQRTAELSGANTFLRSILSSMRGAMIVVNNDMNVLIWNLKSEDLWGLRSDEVQGKSLMSLDIGLPVQELRKPIRNCLTGTSDYQAVVVDAFNRRGKSIKCRVVCSRVTEDKNDAGGVIVLAEELND